MFEKYIFIFWYWKWPAQGTGTEPIVSAHFRSLFVLGRRGSRRHCCWQISPSAGHDSYLRPNRGKMATR